MFDMRGRNGALHSLVKARMPITDKHDESYDPFLDPAGKIESQTEKTDDK